MTGWSGSSLVTALTLNLILSGGPLDMFAVSRSVPSDETKLEQTNFNQKKKRQGKTLRRKRRVKPRVRRASR